MYDSPVPTVATTRHTLCFAASWPNIRCVWEACSVKRWGTEWGCDLIFLSIHYPSLKQGKTTIKTHTGHMCCSGYGQVIFPCTVSAFFFLGLSLFFLFLFCELTLAHLGVNGLSFTPEARLRARLGLSVLSGVEYICSRRKWQATNWFNSPHSSTDPWSLMMHKEDYWRLCVKVDKVGYPSYFNPILTIKCVLLCKDAWQWACCQTCNK